ncbi:hypothetical protein J8F10_13630 [Gemmata sp. G18]|uniref:Uncharacterized protein n=1 Tax=Gemmata palustris TaxID=2822762 RepID=A0ABS5BRI6_9BACT|nr:hypothetical protein [Gemmata palustris]MBP3956326.1 hypothetical protein [Gemmata palustris]
MAITHTIAQGWGGSAGSLSASVGVTSTNANEQNFSATLAAPTTNQQRDVQWAQAKLLAVYILSDQDVVLKVNSSSSPTDTITIKASYPFCWIKGCGLPYPFTGTAGTVTTTYWSNSGSAVANVEFRSLIDQ